ncbi:DUF6443 domain-containing protein [Flavobacterium sp. EDS]|uniref:DUF6443 domain-containing protein n=1 Tax=Flavobacterium sp. EDS TaxID=2897328 RepID=UPI001E62687A|nr:DUF6443 domain-containing protein [Flavobacterium sp. EDS]MCD0476767.1 DUF6443 domain-containing protein [Flavobacterium sp. EDS]
MKKYIPILIMFLCVSTNIVAQTFSDDNFIYTITPKKAIKAGNFNSLTKDEINQNVSYFDGLGRPIQTIAIGQGDGGLDIITPVEYDGFGRQLKEYLPYASSNGGNSYGKIDPATAINATVNYYSTVKYENTTNPFSEKKLESAPLNRVLKQAAPGNAWAMNNGHEIKFEYQTNEDNEVKLYKATATWDAGLGLYNISFLDNGHYEKNQLYKTITYDENTTPEAKTGTEEFKNKQGQVVLKRTYESQQKHDTYYVYDTYGNLTYVIPPKADGAITEEVLNGLCYQYKYDNRNRLAEKKLPGKQWEFIVYDKRDRPVATGPANSPFNNDTAVGWLITKYDAFSRPIYTGWLNSTPNASSRKTMQDAQDTTAVIFETKQKTSGTIDKIAVNYSNAIEPKSFTLLTVNYYDNYSYPNAASVPTTVEGQAVLVNTKGLATGSWTRVLTTATSILGETSSIFYDDKARPIRSYLQNHLSGYTITDNKLDFTGKTLYTITKHKRESGATELIIKEEFTYTAQDRLFTHTHQINGGVIQLLSENNYDELGQLKYKRVGNNTGNPLQKIDYTYNIRGWLTAINKTDNLEQDSDPKDLFAFKINYNKVDWNSNAAKALYNGNIAETSWTTGSDVTGVIRGYGYQYDQLNRLKDATYQTPSLTDNKNYFGENLDYDKNGNIMHLERKFVAGVGSNPYADNMDNLGYFYQNNSNQLMKVSDTSNSPKGFKDDSDGYNDSSDDYAYDGNGNLIKDENKNITEIRYNHLNLPTKITFGTNGNIVYIYNATGQKLEKIVTDNGVVTQTKYLGGFQYKNDVLQYFPTAEGYVNNTPVNGANSYNYVFNYTDHLGNVRVSYKKNAQNVLEILEENNYYPFGLKHEGYNTDNKQPNYKYKYNGKELQDELGLNMYDYGARNYDSALGRWMNIDPKAELYYSMSPYVYVANNPMRYIDPNGMEIINGETARRQRLESQNKAQQENLNNKYNGNTNLSKKDFASKEEYKEYKSTVNSFEKISNALEKSVAAEANIQASIDDFKATDPTNFDKANNLTSTDSNGTVQNIDITLNAGNAYEFGGAVTKTGFNKNTDGTFNSIASISTTLDFGTIKPVSNVLAHEMGHAYNNVQNPTRAMQDTTTHNCQDPSNRNTFQSKTAMDWQERYDTLKAQNKK